ncbi:SAM-dependent methyltransferase [Segetibacter koreensis]|uniref:SAM-dependent methyltransferase n=1 Tax=Segetibacter koreensis TaxID=398037 RepID=UPI00037D7EF4|nr:SAM-dependent methyltransferase [Segetibacter koreensis]
MSRFYSYINTPKTILSLYTGDIPFSAFLKNFFSKEKKYGSRDRRTISSLCYYYFRTGHAIEDRDLEERILTGLFLCTTTPNEILENKKPEWNEKVTLPLAEKISVAKIDVEKIFAFNDELSKDVNAKLFNTSFLIQPKLFARVRPGKQQVVKQKLEAAQTNFEEINNTCLAFANGTKLEAILDINKEVVIQDYNSQRVGELMTATNISAPVSVWDCCAASGGKAIMAYDILRDCKLTVSDVRQTIIQNLHKRLKDAGIKDYYAFVTDLTNHKNLQSALNNKKFDFIICDAPCSGSGTWSRTPEQLLFLKKEEITRYSDLQKSICVNTIPFLKKGGYFLYITCSVFKKENEDIIHFIQDKFSLTLVKMELLKGYEIQADTMFATLFQLT